MSLSVERLFNPSLYVKLLGRAGGQTVYGGTGSADALTLYSTTHATKGDINLADVMHIHENDMQVVIGTNSPYKTSKFFVQHTYTGTTDSYGTFQGLTWTPSNTTSALIGAMGFTVQLNGSNNVTGQIKGIEGFVLHAGTGTLASALGASYLVQKNDVGPITASYGVSAAIQNNNATGAITIAYPFSIGAPTATGAITFCFGMNIANQGATNITAAAGIYITKQTGASLNYDMYAESANVLFNANNNSGATWSIYGTTDNNLLNIGTTNQSIGVGTANVSTSKLKVDGTYGKMSPFYATRENTSTQINHGGGYGSGVSTVTVDDASGFSVGDKVTIEATVLNAIAFTWYESIYDLEIDSISGNDITFTTSIGKQGCNDNDRVLKQDMTHTSVVQKNDTSSFKYVSNFLDVTAKSINKYLTGLGINTSEGYSAQGMKLTDEDGNERIWLAHGKIRLTKSVSTGIALNVLRGPGGFAINDTRLLDAGTGRLRQISSLAEDGIRIGMPNTDAGADDIFQQTRGGSIQVVGDSSGRDVFRVNHNIKYNVTIGSHNVGSATANPSASITAGATTVSLDGTTIEPRYGFTFLGNFTTGATVTITEAAKSTTTSVITINREAATLTLTTPAADNYTTAAVITQLPYTPDFTITQGNSGNTTFAITGETGALTLSSDQTTDTAPNDDTTIKKLTLQKLAAAPTNAAYLQFSNNPGTDNFYLVLEEA